MDTNKKTGRIVGALLLLIFVIGVLIYQYLRGPIVFADDYLANTALNSDQIIASTLLAFLSGTMSIVVAVILLPLFKQNHAKLAYLYVAFCVVGFMAIALENNGVMALLEVSNEYVGSGLEDTSYFQSIGAVYYRNHRWAHYTYLLVSCLPVFVLYLTLFYSRLIPRAISIFGIVAVVLMFIEVLMSMFEVSAGVNLMIPMGLVQLFLPLWLIVKGLKDKTLDQV